MKIIAICIIFLSFYCAGQSSLKENKKPKLIYFYVSEGCPSCNTDHPELKYNFIIECIGCMESEKIIKHNTKTIKKLDKKHGQGWTEKYIKNYCKSAN